MERGEKRYNCPYCVLKGKSADTKGHLYVNEAKGVFHCKRCDERGRWDGKQTLRAYKAKPSRSLRGLDLFTFNIKGGERQFEYISKRLPEDVVRRKCRWTPTVPNRVFFPFGEDYWQARSIDGKKPKYLTYGRTSEYVYNAEEVEDFAVILEGPINALSTPHGVAIFGKALSRTQEYILTFKYKRLIVALDYGAEKEAKEMQKRLANYVKTDIIYLEDERDANNLGWDYMEEKIKCLDLEDNE